MSPIQTTRLILREATPDDAPFFYELMNSEGWLRNIGDRGIHDEGQARVYIENKLVQHYATHGFGLWVAVLLDGGEAVGICGLLRRAELDAPDIGFAFLPQYHGQGMALEAATATVASAVRDFRFKRLLAITIETNDRSIRLLEKVGLRFEQKVVLPGGTEELMLFAADLMPEAIAGANQ